MGPAIHAAWRATSLPDGHGSINAGFNNGTLTFEVIEEGVKTFAGSTPFTTAMLWLVGPPLALWVLWLIVRRRPEPSQAAIAGDRAERLPAGSGPAPEWRVKQDDRLRVERDGIRTPNP
jgi:hypothetical protein